MKKISWIIFIVAILLTLTVCGGSGANGDDEFKTTPASGDVVSAELPSGWSLISGTDMNGVDLADFICHAEEFELGAPTCKHRSILETLRRHGLFWSRRTPMGPIQGQKSWPTELGIWLKMPPPFSLARKHS